MPSPSSNSVPCGGREGDFLVEDGRGRHKATMGCARWLPPLAAGRRGAGALFLFAGLGVRPPPPAQAGDTQTDFLPELNAYVELTDTTRLSLLGSLTQHLSDGSAEGEVDVHFDVALKPILRSLVLNTTIDLIAAHP